VGTDARIEVDSDFYRPTSFTFIPRGGIAGQGIPSQGIPSQGIPSQGTGSRFAQPPPGVGLSYEADEVARCLATGLLESPLMPLDESIAIMETMDAVLAQTVPRNVKR
jgi:hypothetical protein